MEENKYKEALERAKSAIKECGNNVGRIKMIESIFPELKESEDEQHRKWILEYLYDGLRKSDEQFKDQFKSAIAWLEKQGEQKPFDYEHATIIQKDFAPKDYHDIDPHFGISVEDLMSKEKPADKVEPKFKVGDWVVCEVTNSVYQIKNCIENLSNHKYGYDLTNGGYIGSDEVNHYHLWTIQDAKDGDVLVNGSNIFIFHFINGTRLMGYCHVNIDDGRFYDDLGKNECFCLIDAIVTPATKEQRELLFRKMEEAEYAWNPIAKELSHKEVTKKSDKVWNEEDEEMKDLIDEISCHNDDVDYETHVRITRWLNELKQRLS